MLRGKGDGGDEEEGMFPLVEGGFGEVVYAEEGDDGLPLSGAEVDNGILLFGDLDKGGLVQARIAAYDGFFEGDGLSFGL